METVQLEPCFSFFVLNTCLLYWLQVKFMVSTIRIRTNQLKTRDHQMPMRITLNPKDMETTFGEWWKRFRCSSSGSWPLFFQVSITMIKLSPGPSSKQWEGGVCLVLNVNRKGERRGLYFWSVHSETLFLFLPFLSYLSRFLPCMCKIYSWFNSCYVCYHFGVILSLKKL